MLSEREWLTAQLDAPTTKECFPHFANGVVMKPTERLAPAHTRSLTFHVVKTFLIPNPDAWEKVDGLQFKGLATG